MMEESERPDRALYFSTDFVPVRDRLAYLREALGRSTARLDLGPVEGRPLGWSASLYSFDGLGVISGETDGVTCRRTQPLLADGNDDFLLTTNLSGSSQIFQAGRECRLQPGDAVLKSSSDVGAHDFPGPARYLTLRVSRRRLNSMAVEPEDALARLIPANTEPLRLLVDYVQVALRRHQLASPHLAQLFTNHVHDLIALAVGATRETSDMANGRGLQAARLSAIKGDITSGLGSERLDIASIARRRGVTPRYVQMLFEAEGTTFTEYVLEQRLARAHRMLADPGLRDWTIGAIAFEAGFGNLSYFNRVFRRVFGATPSDIRAGVLPAG
ncbi:MAG: AraC family transcriptional regulator [Xanthobacteraceae bacterium]|jgi:AraC-like DNA-binding protein